jgi:hypothetical protein
MIGEGDCGAIGGMKIGTGNRSTRRKPAPAPLCPPQIPLEEPGSNPGRRGGNPATNPLDLWRGLAKHVSAEGNACHSDVYLTVYCTGLCPIVMAPVGTVHTN